MQTCKVRLAFLVFTALLASCGGGGGGGGSAPVSNQPGGTPQTAMATTSGTLTGFGSAIIDGIRVDDHSVLAMLEKEDGTLFPGQLKIGQQVAAMHDANHVATSMHIVPSIEGKVDAVDTGAGTLTVLGQKITINTDSTKGPVTVFESPYTALADVHVSDLVEVHGIPRIDSATGKATLQATRIEQASADTALHTSGLITNLSTSAKTFSLGALVVDYSQAQILPQGATLANGEMVHVAVPLGTVSGSTPVKAVVVKVTDHSQDSHDQVSEVGGQIASVNAAAKTFTVNGVTVDASAANFPQPTQSLATLQAGSYVVAIGTYDTNGVLKAQQIVVRGATSASDGGQTELHGTVLNFVSMSNFTVRGVTVDASTAHLDASCGSITQLANNMQVEVLGTMQTSGVVKAVSISCEEVQPGQSIVGANGTVNSVDSAASTFVIATQGGTQTVKWTSTTNFVRADVTALQGKRVEVQGTMQGNVLVATQVVLGALSVTRAG